MIGPLSGPRTSQVDLLRRPLSSAERCRCCSPYGNRTPSSARRAPPRSRAPRDGRLACHGPGRPALALLCTLGLAASCKSTPPAAKAPAPAAEPGQGARAGGQRERAADHDGGGRWTPAGFGGAGNFLSVHVDPRDSEIVYAASDVAGVYRSADRGETWELRSRGLGNYEVASFAIDPFDRGTLYAGVGAYPGARQAGLYISRDAGKRWRQLPASRARRISFRKYRTMDSIAPDPRREGVLLVGSAHAGLFRATGRGERFTRVLRAPRTGAPLDMSDDEDELEGSYVAPISSVRFDPHARDVVWATLYGVGIFRSDEGGARGSWKRSSRGLPRAPTVKSVAPGKGVLYAALARAGVYRSDDGGKRWRAVNGKLPLRKGWVTSVAVHPERPRTAWIALASHSETSVWQTDNGGRSWTPRPRVSYRERDDPTRRWSRGATLGWWVGVDPGDPSRLYYTDFWGVQRSDDGGRSWVERVRGAQNVCVTSLTVEHDRPGDAPQRLFAAHMDAGILVSTDRGRSWEPVIPTVYDPKLAGHYWRFAIAGSGEARRYYATLDPWAERRSKILRSRDGVRWEVVFDRERPQGRWMGGALLGLAVHPAKPGTVYAAADGGRVWVTRDGGERWRPTPGQPGDRSFTWALAVDREGRVFAGTLSGGLWRSGNGGRRWARVLRGQGTVWKLAVAGGAIYASAGDANLYRSTDGGDTWRALTDITPPPAGDDSGDQGMGIAIHPADPKQIAFSHVDTSHSADASATGLWESTDGGKSWRRIDKTLQPRHVISLSYAPDGTLYAGTWGAGSYRRRPPR